MPSTPERPYAGRPVLTLPCPTCGRLAYVVTRNRRSELRHASVIDADACDALAVSLSPTLHIPQASKVPTLPPPTRPRDQRSWDGFDTYAEAQAERFKRRRPRNGANLGTLGALWGTE